MYLSFVKFLIIFFILPYSICYCGIYRRYPAIADNGATPAPRITVYTQGLYPENQNNGLIGPYRTWKPNFYVQYNGPYRFNYPQTSKPSNLPSINYNIALNLLPYKQPNTGLQITYPINAFLNIRYPQFNGAFNNYYPQYNGWYNNYLQQNPLNWLPYKDFNEYELEGQALKEFEEDDPNDDESKDDDSKENGSKKKTKKKKSKKSDSKKKNSKKDDSKKDDTKTDDSNKDDSEKDESKKDDPNKDDPKKDDPKKDKSKKDDPNKNDSKKDDPKEDETKMDNSKMDNSKKDNPSKDD